METKYSYSDGAPVQPYYVRRENLSHPRLIPNVSRRVDFDACIHIPDIALPAIISDPVIDAQDLKTKTISLLNIKQEVNGEKQRKTDSKINLKDKEFYTSITFKKLIKVNKQQNLPFFIATWESNDGTLKSAEANRFLRSLFLSKTQTKSFNIYKSSSKEENNFYLLCTEKTFDPVALNRTSACDDELGPEMLGEKSYCVAVFYSNKAKTFAQNSEKMNHCHTKAKFWYERAARYGNSDASFHLAKSHFKGEPLLAINFLNQAAITTKTDTEEECIKAEPVVSFCLQISQHSKNKKMEEYCGQKLEEIKQKTPPPSPQKKQYRRQGL